MAELVLMMARGARALREADFEDFRFNTGISAGAAHFAGDFFAIISRRLGTCNTSFDYHELGFAYPPHAAPLFAPSLMLYLRCSISLMPISLQ